MIAVRNALLTEGREVPVTKLCTWLGLARSSAYYQPRTDIHNRPVDEVLTEHIRMIIQEHPNLWRAPGAVLAALPARLARQPQEGASHHAPARLDDAPASQRHASPR